MRKNHKTRKSTVEVMFNRVILGTALSLLLIFVMNAIDYFAPFYAGFIFDLIIFSYILVCFLIVRRQKTRTRQENPLA